MSEFLVFIKQMDTLTSHKSHDNYNMAYVVAYIQISLIQFRQYVILEAPSQNLSHSRMNQCILNKSVEWFRDSFIKTCRHLLASII